ncbi:GGDEF domain-containing protein [Zestomonas thermotolerans]|uniref:GGDEF domain-containing protein n=1 Tax=Zestomonas thermotolerans TaxID=157784 RepID=UPI00037A7CDE|nr:GGDEF domain-containing protein [Pseudomonas thermotolerans]MBO2510221.1 GGDEF domain-containing protein [Gammaproteobacteria bacterium]
MTTHQAWLDEARSNPYAEQIAAGFRWLRFVPELEREYRHYMQEDTFDLRRFALCAGMLVWLGFSVLDCFLMPASRELAWMLAIRGGVLVLLLVCGLLILMRRHHFLLTPLSLTCILSAGLGGAAVVAVAHRIDPTYPYEGLLLICMAAYFLAGLRLSESLTSSMVVLLGYVGLELLSRQDPLRLFNNLFFLSFGNLMGLLGCYLLEYKSRQHFLVSRQLRLLAERDGLTGLYNRRSFDRQLERLWRQAQREGVSVALLLCDIDHFKAYNDHYGHQAGDGVLRQVAAVIGTAARRPLDMAVRLGGEEFAVLLYDIDLAQALGRAEALRARLAKLKLAHERSPTAGVVTLSVGAACLAPGEGSDRSQLYAHADRALYEAKAFGRNQVVA